MKRFWTLKELSPLDAIQDLGYSDFCLKIGKRYISLIINKEEILFIFGDIIKRRVFFYKRRDK